MTWCPLKAKPVTRAFREVQRCPNEPLKAEKKCRTPKVVRNKDDLSERKISRSKLNRKKRGRQKMSSSFFRRVFVTVARSFLGLVLCRNKHKRAMTAQTFHRRGSLPGLRGPIWAWFVYGKTAKANAPRHRAFVSSQKIKFHHKFVSVWIKRVFVFECKANANNFDNFADIACVWARNMLK